ncbi:MAG: carboxylating nicotinate-nucleotide diphosphorylase [Acidobacteriia bacterium]|nr:carboxylating nicotinate-nucleotide diphosphorylase [Terriglobia bacterium]
MALSGSEIEQFIDRALAEDIGAGDITSTAVIPQSARLRAEMRSREALVVAGLDIALGVFRRLEPECRTDALVRDGDRAAKGAALARIEGPARGLLTAERTALNILQHLSGIATLTRSFVERVAGTGAVILDTRKTVPGLRLLAKYATALGGAQNHRFGLYDGVLIKDNHIAVCGGIRAAVEAAKARGLNDIEVECDDLDQVTQALELGVSHLLLDNMDHAALHQAVMLAKGRATTEASGGVSLETVRAIAETGVDYISVGRITQSAPAVDIGLDYAPTA